MNVPLKIQTVGRFPFYDRTSLNIIFQNKLFRSLHTALINTICYYEMSDDRKLKELRSKMMELKNQFINFVHRADSGIRAVDKIKSGRKTLSESTNDLMQYCNSMQTMRVEMLDVSEKISEVITDTKNVYEKPTYDWDSDSSQSDCGARKRKGNAFESDCGPRKKQTKCGPRTKQTKQK